MTVSHSKRSRDYLGGTVMIALGLAVALHGSTYEMGTLSRMGPGFFPVALGVLLTLCGVAIAISARFTHYEGKVEVQRPEWRAWFCICAGIIAFVALGRYGGLVPATFAIVFISALGDRDNTVTSAAILALACVVVAVVVFRWGLQLQFPLFQWS
jgi:uncharacterized membrane protein